MKFPKTKIKLCVIVCCIGSLVLLLHGIKTALGDFRYISADNVIPLNDSSIPNTSKYTQLSQNALQKQNNTTDEARTQMKELNISFLKVHKAGSTTLQNLLFRFGTRHNLSIALPRNGNIIQDINDVVSHKYNIFALHTEDKGLFDRLSPPGSVKIAAVREPVDRMISAAFYYRDVWKAKYLTRIPRKTFIHDLIMKYDKKGVSYTHNQMGFDFGLSNINIDTIKLRAHLDRLNSEFRLVMVVEKFDESLVMLKRYLNWSFLDIIYLKSNSHEHKPMVLTEEEQIRVRKNNVLDFAVYEYFTGVFEQKLKSMSADFHDEVEYFKGLLAKVFEFCTQKDLSGYPTLLIDKSPWDEQFTIRTKHCKMMKTEEMLYIKKLLENKQRPYMHP